MNLRASAIAACILAFLSLPFEWWTLQQPTRVGIVITGETINVYLYRTIWTGTLSTEVNWVTLEGWETIILMLAGAVLASLSGIIVEDKRLWLGSGICIAAGAILFSARWLNLAIQFDIAAYPNVGVLTAILAAVLVLFGFLKLRREQIKSKEIDIPESQINETVPEGQIR